MVVINFKCKKCKAEFDCNVGKVFFPNNIEEKLSFEKDIICHNCGAIKVDDAELTEIGQSDITELDFNNYFRKQKLKSEKPNKKFNISYPRHMYWTDKLKNPNKCPKCNLRLQKEQYPFFVIVDEDPFIIGCDGLFCSDCFVIVLDNNEFGEIVHSYINKKKFKIHVAGIIDLNAIPEDKKMIPIQDLEPLPLVAFKNYSNSKEHEDFIKDKSVFKKDEINYSTRKDSFPKKVGRNEPCPCGSGKKYKKCCLN